MLVRDNRVFIAGHNGMVGSAIMRRLVSAGYRNLLTAERRELDLADQRAVFAYLERHKPDYVVVAAAKVGGILANATYRADFIYENLAIETNLIHGAWRAGVRNLLFLGSSCIYPKFASQPMAEDALLTGELEYTNEPYAIAKIAGIRLCESYNLQYGTNYISVMPTNLYGPNDNFDLERSHVLPAMLRKFHLGKCLLAGDFGAIRKDFERRPQSGVTAGATEPELLAALARYGISSHPQDGVAVTLWGSGSPLREFLHSDDLADACVHLMERVSFSDTFAPDAREVRNTHINIGSGTDLSIRDLAGLIARVVGYRGVTLFDTSKPDGTPRKLLNVEKLRGLGWSCRISLEAGVARVYEAYCS